MPDDRVVDVAQLTKAFDGLRVFDCFSVSIERGEVVAIVGPSGCGKTTLLRLVNGILQPDGGSITFGCGTTQSDVVGVMQKDLLLPWRRVRGNLQLGSEARGDVPPRDAMQVWTRSMGLESYLDFYPSQLSGGMRKKVSLVRSLLAEPQVLLLDEPFGSIDYDQKIELEGAVSDWLGKTSRTAIWVTHDIEEAIAVSDRVLVLGTRPADHLATVEGLRSVGNPVDARQDRRIAEKFKQVWSLLRGVRA